MTATRPRRLGWWVALGACVLVGLLLKLPQLLTPMGQDQGLYHTVAEIILRGGVPYRDVWDPKPPGVFYVHAALLAFVDDPWRSCKLGTLQPRCGTLLFGISDFAYSLGVGALVWRTATRLGFTRAAAVLAFGLTLSCSTLAVLDAEGSTPEKYALAPAVGVILAGLRGMASNQRRWFVLAGVLAALAALFKPPDLASFGALSLVLLVRRRARDVLWLWLPLLGVLLGVWVTFAAMGAGAQLLDATVGYNLARFGFQSTRIPFAAVVAAGQLFRDGLAVLWLPALLGFGLAWARPTWRLLAVWALLDVLALFAGGTKFTREYFVQLVPSLSLLASAAVQLIWTAAGRGWLGRAWLVLSLAAIGVLSNAFQAGYTMRIWNEYVAHGWTTTSVDYLAAMLARLPAGETVFVWGDEAELYTLSGRLPTTRFLNTAGLAVTGDPAATARRAELLAALTRTPPGVIVVDRRTADDDPDGRLGLNPRYFTELAQLLASYDEMEPAILQAYLGGDREQVFVRPGSPDLCQSMPSCRLR